MTNHQYRKAAVKLSTLKDFYDGIILMIDPKSLSQFKGGTKRKVKKSKSLFPHTNPLSTSITYLDIGASLGLPSKWEQFVDDEKFNLILVEPDKVESDKLKVLYPEAQIINYGLGNFNGESKFHLTVSPTCSSVLEPDMDYFKTLSDS